MISDSTLLLVLRHTCYVGRHVLFSTSILLISATTLLLSTSVLLISATTLLFSASTLLLCATTPEYCIVPSGIYCVASYSLLMLGLVVKQLYDKGLNKNKNKEMYIILIRMYLRVPLYKYKFCSTYGYLCISICFIVPTSTFVQVKCSVVPSSTSVSKIKE